MTTPFSDAKAVLEANQAFYKAFESLDIQRMEGVWLHSDEIRCVHPGWALLSGWDEVMQSWARIFENSALMQLRISDADVQVSADLAWVVCTENITSVVGSNVSQFQVQATNVFARRKGQWRIMHHHGSPIGG
ncbi:MAG: nuclear transport factor 2 family protein [SAR202 cluster bacterium]|nr:nuclear transport factor 2 family protein [SAR202 cluster bacterium]